jgi:DNA primase
VSKYDLERADGRVDATREAARLVSSIRDRSKVEAFAREIAGMVGVDVEQARAEVRRAANRRPAPTPGSREPARADSPPARQPLPELRDPRFALERETLKLVVQEPAAVASVTKDVGENDFTHPTYRTVWGLVERAGGIVAAGPDWAGRLRDLTSDPAVAAALSALAVEPLLSKKGADEVFVANTVYRLQELTAQRRIAELKSRLQRTNPVEQTTEYNRMFGELTALEQHRRQLRDLALGSS